MGFFNKLFGSKKKKNEKDEVEDEVTNGLSFKISTGEIHNISVTSSPVGVSTGSTAKDFYVYLWFIKDTGEVFYVGKGRGDRYKAFHERAYEAEKIREMYDTDTRFVGTELTEEQAIELESKEMERILNETNDRLTNRITQLLAKRDNGYNAAPSTPELKFEAAPYLYASEIEEHWFGTKHRAFDEVKEEYLKSVVFITKGIRSGIDRIYGGDMDKCQEETLSLLSMNGSRIMKSQYAKSVTAWIYVGDDYVTNYELHQKNALERIGRNIPTYHLIDVRRFLMGKYGELQAEPKEEVEINPVHNRVPLDRIRNSNNWEKGYDEGMPYWQEGDRVRKDGDIEGAIELFDKARYNGYDAPALYNSYAMAYRKLKDYDNEIAVIDEAIERTGPEGDTTIMKLKERRRKSVLLKQKAFEIEG